LSRGASAESIFENRDAAFQRFVDGCVPALSGAAKFAGRGTGILRNGKALPSNGLGEFLLNPRMVQIVGCRSRVAGRVA
jgi:hypothetical protein